MKEMKNSDFIHTLDAVYNLCSEIKEFLNVETEKQEDEGSEGIVLLSDNLQRLRSLKVQNNHTHVIDFKTSRPFLWQTVMTMIILFLLVGNAYQFKQNLNLSDNDLKYRLIKMYGGISGNELDTLEVVFHRDRDKTVIRNIRNEVEDFEYRIRVRAEKLERARLLQQEAEALR